MTGVFIFIEWLASVTESVLNFVMIDTIAERNFDKRRHWMMLFGISGLIGVGVVLLNLIDLRISIPTIFYAILVWLIGSNILYRGKTIEFLMMTICWLFFMVCVDNLAIGFTAKIGIPEEIIVDFGIKRAGLIFIAKGIQVILVLLFNWLVRRAKDRVRVFSKGFITSVICVCAGGLGSIYFLWTVGNYVGVDLNMFQCIFGMMLIFAFAVLYLWLQMQKEKKEKAYTMQQNSILEKNYTTAKESYETNAKLYHDMKNHFLLLQSYLKENRVEEAEAYLKKLSGDGMKYDYERYTGIEAIDYILSQKREKAENNRIHMKIHGEYPKDCKIDPVDLCTILTNLLDNAVEACMKQPEGELRDIQVTIRRLHQFIIIKIANSSIASPDIRNGKLHTSKKDRNLHGWGMRSVLSAVEKYQGTVQYEYREKMFTVSAMLFYQ